MPTNVHTANTTRRTLDRIGSKLEHSIPGQTMDVNTEPLMYTSLFMHVQTPLHFQSDRLDAYGHTQILILIDLEKQLCTLSYTHQTYTDPDTDYNYITHTDTHQKHTNRQTYGYDHACQCM